MSRVLTRHNIDQDQFDTMIRVVTDAQALEGTMGSGGASALLVDGPSNTELPFHQGATKVSVRFMDVMAIMAALQFHRSKLRCDDRRVYRVLILTDNADLVEEARSKDRAGPEWLMLQWFEANGYEIHWKWESLMAKSRASQVVDASRIRQMTHEAAEETWSL